MSAAENEGAGLHRPKYPYGEQGYCLPVVREVKLPACFHCFLHALHIYYLPRFFISFPVFLGAKDMSDIPA